MGAIALKLFALVVLATSGTEVTNVGLLLRDSSDLPGFRAIEGRSCCTV
jgi:hypothetical protein